MNGMRGPQGVAAAALLAVMAVLLAVGLRTDGMTNDEVLYIAAGHRHLAASDYRLNPTTPPLAKLVMATGLVGGSWRVPELGPGEDEMSWSYRFVHEENDAGRLLRRARVPMVLLALLMAALVWLWARQTAGASAGLVALALVAFHPSLLAHGHLASTDLAAAAAMLLASWSCWRWCRDPGTLRAALTGLALGAAVATRLTGWLLLPCLLILALSPAGRPVDAPRPTAGQRWTFVAALAVLVPLVVWASYGFHHAPWPGQSVAQPVPPRLGLGGTLLQAVQRLRLFPEAYLEGARYQVWHGTHGHPAYLLGERSRTGWWHYFLVAFAVKNTPGFLLATAGALAVVWRARRGAQRATLVHWALPAALVFLFASAGRVQIGERYILPVYLYLSLLAATAAAPLLGTRRGRLAVAGALALHALPTLAVTPAGHLTYFNLLAGGPRGGHRVLLDSNLDWGQDLPRLAAWMRRQGVARVQLAYHGSDHPARLGIEREDLPGLTLYPLRPPARTFAGVVAVSPNLLFGVFPRLGDPYRTLRERGPDDRAGVFFIYFMDAHRPLRIAGP